MRLFRDSFVVFILIIILILILIIVLESLVSHVVVGWGVLHGAVD